MDASLDSLVQTLEPYQLAYTSRLVPPEHFHLVQKKGIYPYDFVKDPSVFKMKQLPPKEAFYNRLNNTHVTDEDYAFAQEVWTKLGFQTFEEYHMHYLKLDTLLLMDCVKAFRVMGMENFEIDAAHCYSCPGFSWQAVLKYVGVQLELITDYDMFLFLESAKRGGLC